MHFQHKIPIHSFFFNFSCTMSFFENAVICAMFTDITWKFFRCQRIINTLSEDKSSVLSKYCVAYCICCVAYCICCVAYCICCVAYCICCVVYCICCVVYCICAVTMEIFQNCISDVSHFFYLFCGGCLRRQHMHVCPHTHAHTHTHICPLY